MKKHIKLFVILAAILLLVSCGKKDEIINAELSRALSENASFDERLTQIDTDTAEKRYMLNSKDYNEITAYTGTASVCDEYVIIKTSNPEGVAEKLKKYIESKKKIYESYRPNEVYKLDNAVIEQYKDAVVMIVTDDTLNAVEVYKEYLKK